MRRVLAGVRKRFEAMPRIDFSALPAARALCWLVAGVLLGLGDRAGLPGASVLGLALACAMALLTRGDGLRGPALVVLGGAVLARMHMAAPWRTYPDHVPRRICRVWMRGVATTPSSPGETHRRVVLRVESLRTWDRQAWTPCGGAVQVEMRPDSPSPPYGERIEVEGTLAPVQTCPEESLFDYGRHLWKRGIVDRVVADTVAVTGRDGWRAPLAAAYRIRARLAQALASGMPGAEERMLLQAMVLGYRQDLAPETRRQFLNSGTIHVFAISGLHVGIVAMLCGWFLSLLGMPFRARSVLLIPLVGCYVLMCGAGISAVRAWLMLSCWWGSQVLRRPRVPLNAIAVAALLALLWRPLVLLETGFLFSFLVVGVLVAGWPLASDLVGLLSERRWWQPPSCRSGRMARWRLVPVRALAASALAWLGSAGMAAASNGLLVPVGLLLNPFVILLCAPLLGLSAAKIAVSLLGWQMLERTAGGLLGALARCLCGATAVVDLPGATFRICPLPPVLVLAYYGLLLLALVRRPLGSLRPALFAACLLILLAPTLWEHCSQGSDTILAGSGTALPAVLLQRAGGLPPVALNTGEPQRLRALLERAGTNELEAVVLSAASRDAGAGLAGLLAAWPVRTLVVPANYRRSRPLAEAVARREANGARVRVLPDDNREVRIGPRQVRLDGGADEQSLRVSFVSPASARAALEVETTALGLVRVSVAEDEAPGHWTAPQGTAPAVLRIAQSRHAAWRVEAGGTFTPAFGPEPAPPAP